MNNFFSPYCVLKIYLCLSLLLLTPAQCFRTYIYYILYLLYLWIPILSPFSYHYDSAMINIPFRPLWCFLWDLDPGMWFLDHRAFIYIFYWRTARLCSRTSCNGLHSCRQFMRVSITLYPNQTTRQTKWKLILNCISLCLMRLNISSCAFFFIFSSFPFCKIASLSLAPFLVQSFSPFLVDLQFLLFPRY